MTPPKMPGHWLSCWPRMAEVGTLLLIIGVIASIPTIVFVVECVLGMRDMVRAVPSGEAPPFVVLVPAHDEAGGIGATIDAARQQMRPCDRIVVVADNCTDNTAAVARAHGARVVERSDATQRGKGHALAAGRAALSTDPSPIVIVLDADCQPEPGALLALASAASDGSVVQGLYLMAGVAGQETKSAISTFAFVVKNKVRQRGLRALGGPALLQGSGMAFPRDVFADAPLASGNIVEDLELGLTLALAGVPMRFEESAVFLSNASSGAALVSQRVRWEHGSLGVALRHAPKLARAVVKRRLDLIPLLFDILVPPLAMLVSIMIVLTMVAIGVGLVGGGFAAAIWMTTQLVLLTLTIIMLWVRFGGPGLSLSAMARVPGYLLWKLPIYLRLFGNRERRWIRTEREPSWSGIARPASVGVVAIGRNEGERLHVCLASIARQTDRIIYVDSGSSDDSVAYARDRGIQTVSLDPGIAFTAARARNAGAARLSQLWPELEFVQFIDGDCELSAHWLDEATGLMAAQPSTAAVCGARRERFPERSVYNKLCDMEWDAPAGITESCGGDALMRLSAFTAAGGFSDDLIAGEEADLCHRMRALNWQIVRLSVSMTLHDADMMRLSQWWQRNRRSGHAGAEAWHRRGAEDWRLIKPVISNLLWGLPPFWPLWPVLWWRVYRRSGALYATHIVIGKLPHCAGQLGFWWSSMRARRRTLIEYK